MFRSYSRSLWHLASGASPSTVKLVTQTSPRFAIAPLLRQPARIAFSSKSDKENKDPPPPYRTIDREAERKRGQELLGSDPSKVSSQSSVRHVLEEPQAPPTGEHDMAGELKHDIDIVKDTFRFKSVPRESHILGLAGTLPYMATSLSTVFLAWDLNKKWPTGNAFYDTIFVDHETAKHLLSIIEPLQLGYGAVIISFLGAIHWGLEYAEKQPLRERTRFRYGMGLAASIIAWPTLFLPVEYALTTQFMAFVALYFADSRAATRGWAPQWYGTYRFLLTAMVGLAIFISLVGRAKIRQGDSLSGHGLSDNFSRPGIADTKTNWTKLEEEEKERVKREKKKKAKEDEKKKQEEMQENMKSEKGHDQAKTETEDSEKGEEKSEKSDEKEDAQDKKESKDREESEKSKDKGKGKGNDESKGEKNEESEEKEPKDKDEGSKEQDDDDKPKDTESKGGKKE
ncbi:hypothetical protein NCS57_00187100 [Fusarium keratoplasticum]|uniref:Uncharacterized protein n=1 Tax=Fusarium keratoplasticum TaxID=1328300 RepID=A0ACC0RHT1_9HYPO|nr:hypothetical protein NCS57_00187100 [Fusarium keratoplasticum]KAI8685185.1 hypothetical protein NCS57_00187100 [Fusarium keratoplasticum]KAI8689303.1 hypothetical protein NCS55_00187200 [Fusarium keratoplasticum]